MIIMNEAMDSLKVLNCACRAVKCLECLKKCVVVLAAIFISFNIFKAFKKR